MSKKNAIKFIKTLIKTIYEDTSVIIHFLIHFLKYQIMKFL
jgi:hypothetical protein